VLNICDNKNFKIRNSTFDIRNFFTKTITLAPGNGAFLLKTVPLGGLMAPAKYAYPISFVIFMQVNNLKFIE